MPRIFLLRVFLRWTMYDSKFEIDWLGESSSLGWVIFTCESHPTIMEVGGSLTLYCIEFLSEIMHPLIGWVPNIAIQP